MELPPHSTAAYLKRLVDATIEWHLIFASDRVRSQIDPAVARDIEVFVGEARMVRWAMVAEEEHLAPIWELVMPGSIERTDESQEEPKKPSNNVLDYVLQGTAYIKLMVPVPSGHWAEVLAELSRSITWPYRATAITDNIKERAAKSEFIRDLFEHNPWTLFMYLLSISNVPFDADSPLPLDLGNTSSTGEAP